MLSSRAFAPQIYTPRETGVFLRKPRSLTIHRRGFLTQVKAPATSWTLDISNGSHAQQHFRNHLQITSALADNTENIEKQATQNNILQHEHASIVKDDQQTSIWTDALKKLSIFYEFSRPYAIIGTIIGVPAVSLLAVETMADFSPVFFKGLLKALIPAILMNIYVAGVNQLYDIEIDKINKPELPLASGEMSMGVGVAITLAVCLLSFGVAFMFGSPPLVYALILDFLIGSAYSVDLPFLRWKKNPYLTIFCIASRRAIITPLSCYLHIQKYVLGRPIAVTRSLVFALSFLSLVLTVISIFKDIPDVDGDKDFGIQSLSISLGQERVFWFCINSLLIGYGAAVMIGASSSILVSKLVTVLGHSVLASILWLRARSTNIKDKSAVDDLYVFIWKLMFAEYFLIPFVR